jgi:CheY-like chemotaxis protein
VLADIMMPVLNGTELCRLMKSNADYQSILLISDELRRAAVGRYDRCRRIHRQTLRPRGD